MTNKEMGKSAPSYSMSMPLPKKAPKLPGPGDYEGETFIGKSGPSYSMRSRIEIPEVLQKLLYAGEWNGCMHFSFVLFVGFVARG